MRLSQITYFLFNLIPLVDDGKHSQIGFEDMRKAMGEKKVFELLESKFSDSVDFSIYSIEDREEIGEEIYNAYEYQFNRERRKYGVENNGICLLIAYLVEIIQQKFR